MNNLNQRPTVRSLFPMLAMFVSIMFLVNGSVGQEEPKPKGDAKHSDTDDKKKSTPAVKAAPQTDPGSHRNQVTKGFRSTGNKKLDQMKKNLAALDHKTKIKVQIKTLDDAKKKYNEYLKAYAKLTSSTDADDPKQKSQRKRLEYKFKKVNETMKQIDKYVREGRYKVGGVKEGQAIRDKGLNLLFFELFREAKRAEVLAKMWELERKRDRIEFDIKPKGEVVFQYQEEARTKQEETLIYGGESRAIDREVTGKIANAGANSLVFEAVFKPKLEAWAVMDHEHNIVVTFRLKMTPPAIGILIKHTDRVKLKTEATLLVTLPLTTSGYERTLSIEEITKLRTDRKLEIDLSGSPLFTNSNLSMWKLEKKAVLLLTLEK